MGFGVKYFLTTQKPQVLKKHISHNVFYLVISFYLSLF